MNNKIKTTTVSIETQFDGITLKGELEYWAKDYCIKLLEPYQGISEAHLIYASPAKYVIEKSKNSTCIEIDLMEKSIEILKEIYLNCLKELKEN
ncbi:MAG: hypothetical protein AB7D41_04585 [Arcobacter sp.]|uniref:hypothetical protein n=1 Tax=Arcobacter sp. TaxID=1872629 RepID=UPI003D02B800